MRGANQHLSGEEIEQLTGSATDVEVGALEGVMDHLERCELCRFRMLSARDLSGEPPQGAGGARPGSSLCPPEARWLEVAAGLGTAAERKRSIDHAAGCALCGQLLKEAVEDVGMALTEEEETKVVALASAKPEWQSNLVKKIADSAPPRAVPEEPVGPSRKFVFWPRWATAFAALIVAAGGGWWAWILLRAPAVEELLAQAYTEQRTIEMRFPGAKYAPMRVERGPEESNLKKRPALLKAEALIAEGLQKDPNDPALLQAKARADLLDGNYNDAIKSLQRACEAQPDSPSLLTDLGSAYFQRGSSDRANHPDDFANAYETLSKVLAKVPDDPIALFNRALAYERFPLPTEAIADWNHYLTVDPNSEWADEARRHLSELKQKVERKGSALPPLHPASEIALLGDDDESIRRTLDSRIEEYLDVALREWIPAAFSPTEYELHSGGLDSQRSNAQALETLAGTLDQLHGDPWLREFIKSIESDTEARPAVGALSEAIMLNASGQYPEAKRIAGNAEERLRFRSIPGWLRVRVEGIYAVHFLQRGETCFLDAKGLLKDLEGKPYPWLQIQTLLEAAICANMTGRMKDARQATGRAIELAQQHNYSVLYLRGAALMASLDWTGGDFSSAAKLTSAALEKFWSGEFPPMRGYSLYTVLDSIVEDSEQWFAQMSIVREAVSLLANDPDHGLQAIEYQRLANAALRAGELRVAEQSFQESQRQFSLAPMEGTEILRAANEIGMAGLESAQGNFSSAVTRLQKAEPWVEMTSNRFVALDFYLTRAKAFAGSGEFGAATNASFHAVAIAEKGLTTIDGERNRMLWSRAYDRAYRTLVRLRLSEDPYEAFQWWEWYKGAPLRSYESHNSNNHTTAGQSRVFPVSMFDKFRSRPPGVKIPGDTALLSYVLLPDQVGAWFQDSGKVEYQQLPISVKDLLHLSRRFVEHCADRNADLGEIATEEHRLYDVLIQPFSSAIIGHHNILIEADGVLDAIAFEALIDNGGRVLGDDYDIAMSPGMTYLTQIRQVIGPADSPSTLVVGNPSSRHSGGISLGEIPSADQEARRIAAMVPNSQLLVGPDATSSAILSAIQYADIFHFAGHAVVTTDGSALLLAGTPGESSADLLDAVRLEKVLVKRTRLVVLSACGSAGNGSQTLSESSSLARAFLADGVPQVIASRWAVESDATEELMEHFYKHLLSGNSVGDALRLARIELRAVYPRPYHWAAFSVFGRA